MLDGRKKNAYFVPDSKNIEVSVNKKIRGEMMKVFCLFAGISELI